MENNKIELKEKGNIFIQEDCSNSVTTTRKWQSHIPTWSKAFSAQDKSNCKDPEAWGTAKITNMQGCQQELRSECQQSGGAVIIREGTRDHY